MHREGSWERSLVRVLYVKGVDFCDYVSYDVIRAD